MRSFSLSFASMGFFCSLICLIRWKISSSKSLENEKERRTEIDEAKRMKKKEKGRVKTNSFLTALSISENREFFNLDFSGAISVTTT
jgi:hypothetical protein